MKNNVEVLIKIVPKFFSIGFYNQIYYEIVITSKRIILVSMGESYKPWMLSIDPGMNKREELKGLDLEELTAYKEENISIYFDDIENIQLSKRTLLKNANIEIKTKNDEYKLFTKEKGIDVLDSFKLLKEALGEKVIFK